MPKNIVRFFEDCLVTFRAYASIPDTLSLGNRLFVLGFFIGIVFALPAWFFCYPIVVHPLTFMPCTGSLLDDILGYIMLGGFILALVGLFMKVLGK